MLKFFIGQTKRGKGVSLASLLLRLFFGGLMLTHGWPKLQKVIRGDMAFADPIGLGESFSLYLTVFSEFACALLVLIGAFTRLATIPLIITMLVAALIIHGADPLGDKEASLTYLAAYAAILCLGPGKFSLDELILRKR